MQTGYYVLAGHLNVVFKKTIIPLLQKQKKTLCKKVIKLHECHAWTCVTFPHGSYWESEAVIEGSELLLFFLVPST